MTSQPALTRELAVHAHLRERLRTEFPDTDDDTLQDTLEGLTNLHEQLAELVRSALDDEALVAALRARISDMRERAARLAHRAEVKRALVSETMERAEIRRMTQPDLMVTLRPCQPGLTVTDEAAIPKTYWQPQPPKLDRTAVLVALKAGTSVAGAALGNGPHHRRGDQVMAGFDASQIKTLKGKLHGRHVATRAAEDRELSFVEGWFTIAEANRIFGFDAWDRETLQLSCVWQGKAGGSPTCSYLARVRVTVRAGDRTVVREGCGFGAGTGATPGEAHEKALKEAETDAMKRALITFGNRFGLALYDREQRGVTRSRVPPSPEEQWPVHSPRRGTTVCNSSREFYSELRKELECLTTIPDVQALWRLNEPTLQLVRERHRNLIDRAGAHYTAVFARLCRERVAALEAGSGEPGPDGTSAAPPGAPARGTEPPPTSDTCPADGTAVDGGVRPVPHPKPAGSVDKSVLAIGTPRRIRDRDHLAFVAAQPCLVCGRLPAHAHHLTFVQPRARGLKASDEWAVPLCALHHRALHDRGDERTFWAERHIDADAVARAL